MLWISHRHCVDKYQTDKMSTQKWICQLLKRLVNQHVTVQGNMRQPKRPNHVSLNQTQHMSAELHCNAVMLTTQCLQTNILILSTIHIYLKMYCATALHMITCLMCYTVCTDMYLHLNSSYTAVQTYIVFSEKCALFLWIDDYKKLELCFRKGDFFCDRFCL